MDDKIIPNVYMFDEFNNSRQIEAAKNFMNKMRANCFLMVGVQENGEFTLHSEIHVQDLKYMLEKLIKSLPDGKAVVSMDGI